MTSLVAKLVEYEFEPNLQTLLPHSFLGVIAAVELSSASGIRLCPSAADADAAATRRAQLRKELKRFEHSFEAKHGRKLVSKDLASDSLLDKSVRKHVRRLYREYRQFGNV